MAVAISRHERHVERRREADGLGKYRRGAGARHAVQRLVPPFVGRNSEPRNRRRIVLQLRHLLFECHARHEIGGALLEAAVEVLVEAVRRRRPRGERQQQDARQARIILSPRAQVAAGWHPLVPGAVALTYTSTFHWEQSPKL